ncbi:MAG TPA: hypothetical protein EYF95_05675 [Flavobacteriales bacterium]|nr:hypothetical protein [Flavobacteriales bacterium]
MKNSKDIKVGDLVFIRSSNDEKPIISAGICLVVSQSFGEPGSADLIKEKKIIFSILWQGFVDDLVDPEWLILIKK